MQDENEHEPESPRKMSQTSPRKMSDASSLRGAVPKWKARRAPRRRSKSPELTRAFMEDNEFCDTKILVNNKIIYTSKALLTFHSPVFMKYFKDETNATNNQGKGARGGKPSTAQTSKDLDLSDKEFNTVYDMMAFVDPREDFSLTETDAFRLLPLAEEYQMKQLIKESETTLTRSFYRMRKSHRPGTLPLDTTLQYLKVADRFKYGDLTGMCTEECIANESPNLISVITGCDELTEPIKVATLKGKLDRVNCALVKERKAKSERENPKGNSGGKLWRNY